jgi:glycosyltransferase involved in cell wall biosynthesis
MPARVKNVLLAVTNDLVHDQRVHRVALALQADGWEVTVYGRRRHNSPELEPRPYHCVRKALLAERGKLFYLFYALRLLFWLLFQAPNYRVICANDLDTLLPCWLAGRIRGSRVVYDSHEYFTQVPELVERPFTRAIWQGLEAALVPWVDAMYTVNGAIAERYGKRYGLQVRVVRNLPLEGAPLSLSQPPALKPILLYQGMLNPGRGIELMIQATALLPDVELWIVGDGPERTRLIELAEGMGLAHRVRFWGLIPFQQLPEITRQATLGLSLEEDRGLNYRLASPNKIVDYIQAGLPVVVSDLPLMRELVEQWKVGTVLSKRDATALTVILCEMLAAHRYVDMAQNARKAAQELNWTRESERLKQIYREVLRLKA